MAPALSFFSLADSPSVSHVIGAKAAQHPGPRSLPPGPLPRARSRGWNCPLPSRRRSPAPAALCRRRSSAPLPPAPTVARSCSPLLRTRSVWTHNPTLSSRCLRFLSGSHGLQQLPTEDQNRWARLFPLFNQNSEILIQSSDWEYWRIGLGEPCLYNSHPHTSCSPRDTV